MLFSTYGRCKSWVFYAYSLKIYPMDLLSFDAEPLFFDTPPADEVVQLFQQAAENYGDEQVKADLHRA